MSNATNMPTSDVNQPQPRPRKRWLRWALLAAVLVIVLALVLLLALPAIVSSRAGEAVAVRLVNASIPGQAAVDNLSLGWFSGQHASGLKLLDVEGQTVASIQSIDAPDLGLWALLRGSKQYGTITLNGVDARIVQHADGTTNLDRSLGTTPKKKPPREGQFDLGDFLEDLHGAVVLTDARLTYDAPAVPAVQVLVPRAKLSALEPGVVQAQFNSQVQQGADSGSVAADVVIRGLLDDDGRLQLGKAQIQGELNLTQVPVGAVDRLLNQGGALVELLGPVLEAHARAQGSLSAPQAQLSANSQNLQVQAQVDVEQGAVAVSPQTSGELLITPAAFAAFQAGADAEAAARLLEPVRVRLAIEQGRLVRGPQGMDWNAGELVARLQVSDVRVQTAGVGELALRNASGRLHFLGQSRQIQAELSATAQQQEYDGRLNAQATVTYPLGPDGQPQWAASTLQAQGEVAQLPLAMADALLETQGLLVETLGPTLGATFQAQLQPAQGDKQASGQVQLAVQAQHLTQGGLTATVREGRLIVEPGTLAELNVRPQVVRRLAEQMPALQGVSLREASQVAVQVRELSVPVQPLELQQARLDVALTATAMPLAGEGIYDGAVFGPLTVQVGPGVLGQALPLAVDGQASRGPSQARVDLRGQLLQPMGRRVIEAQGQVQASIAPETLNDLTSTSGRREPAADKPRLAAPLQSTVEIQQIRLPLGEGASLADGAVELVAQIPSVQVQAPQVGEVGLKDLRVQVDAPRLGEALNATAQGQFSSAQGAGSLDARLNVQQPLEESRKVTANVAAKSVPVALLESFTADRRLTALLGETIQDLELSANTRADAQLDFSTRLDAPHLQAQLAGQLKPGDYVRLQPNDQAIQFELTPQGFAALQQPSVIAGDPSAAPPPRRNADQPASAAPNAQSLELLSPAQIRVALGETLVGLNPAPQERPADAPAVPAESGAVDLRRVKFDARIESSPILLRRGAQEQPFSIEGLVVTANSTDLRQDLALTVRGEVVGAATPGGPAERSPITSDTRFEGLVNQQGAVDTKQVRARTQTRLQDVPTAVVVAATGADQDYVGVIGPTMTLEAAGQVPGDLDVRVNSQNVKAPFAATITPDRHLRLRQDAVMEVAVTPQLSQTLLKFGSPLLVDAQASEAPIRLTLRAEGFDVPVAQFDLKQAALNADLELGTLKMRRSWARNELEGLVRSVAGLFNERLPFEPGQELQPMNFTPLRAKLAQGVVTTNDVWMWNPTSAMGLQGQIDLAEGRMRMTMGVLGESLLREMPFLRGLRAIQPDAVYEFPASGAVNAPKVDFGRFPAQLALSAGAAAAGREAGEIGEILGGVLQGAGGRAGPLPVASLAWPGKPQLPELPQEKGQAEAQTPQPAQQPSPPQEQPPGQTPQKEQKQEGLGGLLEGILEGVQQEQQREDDARQQRHEERQRRQQETPQPP